MRRGQGPAKPSPAHRARAAGRRSRRMEVGAGGQPDPPRRAAHALVRQPENYHRKHAAVWGHEPRLAGLRRERRARFRMPLPGVWRADRDPVGHIEWPPDEPESAGFRCPHCQALIAERHKPQIVQEGRWRATRPEVKGHAGFRLNALVSLHANASWSKLASEFLRAKDDPAELQTFVNTILGEAGVRRGRRWRKARSPAAPNRSARPHPGRGPGRQRSASTCRMTDSSAPSPAGRARASAWSWAMS